MHVTYLRQLTDHVMCRSKKRQFNWLFAYCLETEPYSAHTILNVNYFLGILRALVLVVRDVSPSSLTVYKSKCS